MFLPKAFRRAVRHADSGAQHLCSGGTDRTNRQLAASIAVMSAVLFFPPVQAQAQEGAAAAVPADAGLPAPIGEQTRAWLELQRSGALAAQEQRLTGPAVTVLYRRYLDSFGHPIPERFEDREGFSSADR